MTTTSVRSSVRRPPASKSGVVFVGLAGVVVRPRLDVDAVAAAEAGSRTDVGRHGPTGDIRPDVRGQEQRWD